MGCCPWSIGHLFIFTTRQTFVSRIKRRDTCNADDAMANTGSCCTPTYLIYPVLLILNWSGKDRLQKKISNVIDTHLATSIVLRPNEIARVGQFAADTQMNWRVEDSSNGCCRSRGPMASPTGPEFEPQVPAVDDSLWLALNLKKKQKSQLWFDHDTINGWRSAETCRGYQKWRGRYQRVVHAVFVELERDSTINSILSLPHSWEWIPNLFIFLGLVWLISFRAVDYVRSWLCQLHAAFLSSLSLCGWGGG